MKVYVLEVYNYSGYEVSRLIDGVYQDYNTAKLAAECLESQWGKSTDFECHITEWDLQP